jgi:hypothetical protein
MKKYISFLLIISISISWCILNPPSLIAQEPKAVIRVWIWGINLSQIYLNVETNIQISITSGSDFDTNLCVYTIDWTKTDRNFSKELPGAGIIIKSKKATGLDVICGLQLNIWLKDVPSPPLFFQMTDTNKYVPSKNGAVFGRDVWFDVLLDLASPPDSPEARQRADRIRNNPLAYIGNKAYMPEGALQAILLKNRENREQEIMAAVSQKLLAIAWGGLKTR